MGGVGDVWVSPDSRIRKTIVVSGKPGLKPTEGSECIIEAPEIKNCENFKYVIGESDDSFERLLDVVLTMMNLGESSEVMFQITSKKILNFNLKLLNFVSNGLICDWDANIKFSTSKQHKDSGVLLFKQNRYIDASHRFSKSLKLLTSIPIPIDIQPTDIDGVKITDIENLKANLYNNLASCYLKHKMFESVINLCEKVLKIDEMNQKALYKMGVAFFEVNDFDRSRYILGLLLTLDPGNKAALEKLKLVNVKVNEANAKVNAMFKKMFV